MMIKMNHYTGCFVIDLIINLELSILYTIVGVYLIGILSLIIGYFFYLLT